MSSSNIDQGATKEAPEFIKDPADGTFKVRNKHTGKLEPAWKHLQVHVGDDFALYVRRCGNSKSFPYDPATDNQVEHPTLWNQRKLRVLLFEPGENDGTQSEDLIVPLLWSTCSVQTLIEISKVPKNGGIASMEWVLRVGFKNTGLEYENGTVVKFIGVSSTPELNGRIGVIRDSKATAKNRYRVITMDFATKKAKLIAVRAKNLELVRSGTAVELGDNRCGHSAALFC